MRLDPSQLFSVTQEILLRAGVDSEQARTVTENLIWCDQVGRRNHGIERLPILLKHVAAGTIHCPPALSFETLTPSVERLDADQAFGHHAGRVAIDRAVERADHHGVGIVGVLNSNFFGAGAYYAYRAAEAGKISLVLSNSFPKVAAPGGLQAALGTNPFAFGAPRRNGRHLLVDMSTAAVAGSTVREKAAAGEQFEPGVAIDDAGEPILDPNQVMRGTLLPAAGAKGFGLGLMVELLSAVLTGAAMSHEVGSMYKDLEKSGNNGHFLLAIDIQKWMPLEAYFERVETLADALFQSGQSGAVRLPGEGRWQHFDDSEKNGIAIEPDILEPFEALAAKYEVRVPWRAL